MLSTLYSNPSTFDVGAIFFSIDGDSLAVRVVDRSEPEALASAHELLAQLYRMGPITAPSFDVRSGGRSGIGSVILTFDCSGPVPVSATRGYRPRVSFASAAETADLVRDASRRLAREAYQVAS